MIRARLPRLARFALIALVPAALNISAASGAASIMVPLCTGDGQVHMVRIPADRHPQPGQDRDGCCAKGCHAGNCRKKSLREIEPSQ
ncbi:MAG: hypothetical protein JSR96_01790 [Proteobacteria bacterium]|nr:hypothetical protein [Pseudomonadota bacterium]